MSRSPSFTVKTELSPKLNPESLQQWVVAFCIIRFDLEQGQLIEECYPPDCLTQDEELEIALSSFPDSVSQHQNRSSIHDCIFFFRFRRRGDSQLANVSSSENTAVDKELSPKNMDIRNLRRSNTRNNNKASRYMYGYVFNRQRHDERLKRGQLMELPIGNAMLKVSLPPAHSLPLKSGMFFEESVSFMAPLLPNNQSVPQGLFHDSDIFGTFRGLLLQLWVLWELLLIGEPILIIAPTPPQCCEAVASLVSLVAPLLYSVDFRPYFTIHDPVFAHLNSLQEGDIFPPMVLGVTNLFFLKALRNIPHIVSVGSPTISNQPNLAARSSSGKIAVRSQAFGLQQLSLKRFSPSNLLSAVKLRRDGPLCLMTEHKEAIWSTYAATTKPDTSILNRLIDAGMSPRVEESMSLVNNEILRRHFLELTTNFLAPFGPYFRSKTPSEGSSPFVDPPPLSPFNADEFLASLSARGPGKFLSKRMKSNWMDLYRRFLKGSNFMPWFQRRRAVAEQEQHKLWRQARMKTDIQQFISKMSELEIVDSFNAIERHLLEELQLQQSGRASADSASSCQKLKGDLRTVFSVLPKDMQQLLLFNPQRAALLQGSSELTKLPGRPLVQVGVVSSTSPR
ncbi:hypothetical protein I3760_15G109000 [Carya illinoinensis]|nr:hypothetical protein I3760_15G109000 [Carya illinoinensis]